MEWTRKALFAGELPALISVDVETGGPVPERYPLLSIGACTLLNPRKTFYVELQPDRLEETEGAASVHGLSMDELSQKGTPPRQAMQQFAGWLSKSIPAGLRPVFVAFNAPFDWMFICEYFHRYLNENPFGHSALDMKAFYMGLTGKPWHSTSWKVLSELYLGSRPLSHNALQDAVDQADLFVKLLEAAAAMNVPNQT